MHPNIFPIISIITPSYNQGRFIERTIKSVLSQKGEFCLEYIILDAGSDDGSVEIIKKYDRLLKEGGLPVKCLGITYKWFSGPDRGQTDALNKGLKMSGGEIVAWLNSDDRYLPGALEKVRCAFRQNPESDFVCGHVYFVDEEGGILRSHHAKAHLSEVDFKHSNQLIQPGVFFKKELLSSLGFLDENFNVAMDYEFWTRAARHGCAFACVDSFLAEFTVRKDAKSSVLNAEMYVEALLVQLKYFGFDDWFIHNWSRYAAEYSEWTGRNPEEAFVEVTEGLIRRCIEKQKVLLAKNRQKTLRLYYLQKAVCKITTSKKTALKYGSVILIRSPFLFLTRSGMAFLAQLLLKSDYYLRVKELFLGWQRKSRSLPETLNDKAKSLRDLIDSFIFLFEEASGFKNKLIIIKFALWNFLRRCFLHPLFLNDIFVELKEAKVWFAPFTGEISAYKEIYLDRDYDLYENFSAGSTDIVFDLGANIGFYTIQQAKRTKQGKVFALEPNPSSYARLKKNIAANNLANVMLFNKAVYSRHGVLGLEAPSSTGTRTVLAENRSGEKVEGWTLDEIIREHPLERVDLMKIDVAGSEAEILKGGENCLRITKKIVLAVHSKELEEQVATILSSCGFQKVFQKKLAKTSILYFVSPKPDI